MRAIERIDPFLDFITNRVMVILEKIWKLNASEEEMISFHDYIIAHIEDIRNYWKLNPDLRFSQVMISMGIIPDIPGMWFYVEEDEILNKLGIPAREYLLWGQYYDKDMEKLETPKRVLIKDMDTDHIRSILIGEWTRNPDYVKCFTEELALRNEKL